MINRVPPPFGVSAGAASVSGSGTLSIANANGVSFGLNGSTLTASVATAYRASTDGVGLNTAGTNVTWTVNSSGVSLNAGGYAGTGFTSTTTGGTAVVGTNNTAGLSLAVPNFLTTAAQSNHSHGNPSLALTNLSGTTASNSAGLTLSLSAAAPGGGGVAAGAGTQTATSGTVVFANSNGVTFGMSGSSQVTASHNGLTSQSNQAFSAGGGSSAFQTLGFSDQNGVSFTNTNGSVGVTHALQFTSNTSAITSNALHTSASRVFNVVAATNNAGGGTASLSSNVSFSAANGATFYTSAGNAVALSYTVPTVTQYFSATNTTFNGTNASGSITNNTNGLRIDLSVNAGGGNFSGGVSNGGNTSGDTGFVTGRLAIVGGNNVTVSGSTNGGSMTLTISGANVGGAQTGISGIQVSNTTYTVGTVTFQNANGISFGSSGVNGISASYTVPSTAGLISAVNVSAGTTSGNLTALTLANANGISFGLNAGTVTASHNGLTTARASNDAVGLNTALTAGPLAWTVNSSGLSLNAGSAAGTTSGFAGNQISGSMTHNTAGLNLSLSHPAWLTTAMQSNAATISNVNVSAGTTSTNASAFTFADGNGVTFGLGTGANAGRVTASVSQTVQTQAAGGIAGSGFTSAGANVGLSGTLNSNGLSLSATAAAVPTAYVSSVNGSSGAISLNVGSSLSASTNGSSVTFGLASNITTALQSAGAYLTTARASNDAVGLNAAQTNVTWTVNSSGLSLNAAGYAGTGTSNTGAASFTLNSNGLAFNGTSLAGVGTTFNGTNVSGSMTLNTAGLRLDLSAANPGGGGGAAISAGANSQNTGTVAFANSNGITFGLSNNGTLTASYNSTQFAGTGTTFAGANISASLTLNSNGLNLSASVAAPGAAAERNDVFLLGANTAGNTTASGSTIGWSGINLTLSGTNNSQVAISAPATSSLSATGAFSISTNGSTISMGVGPFSAYAVGNTTLSSSGTVDLRSFSIRANGLYAGVSNGSIVVSHAPDTVSNAVLAPNMGNQLPFAQTSVSLGQNSLYIYPVRLRSYLSMDHVRIPVMVTNSSSATSSGSKGYTFLLGIYSRNATNDTVLTQHYSTSYTMSASYSSNVSWGISGISAIGNSTSYNTFTATSAGVNLSASMHGPRELIVPVSSVLSTGEWWFAVLNSTNAAGVAGNVLNLSNLCVAHQTYNRLGGSTNATSSGFFQQVGHGTYSATTGALPNGISATQINQLGTVPILFAATGTV